jgi:hypothetical protein
VYFPKRTSLICSSAFKRNTKRQEILKIRAA